MSQVQLSGGVAQAPQERGLHLALCRWRVRVAFLLVVGILVESVINREIPLDIFKFQSVLIAAAVLIAAGVSVRLISLGTVRKNEVLATDGIYSLCRHPLYFGSTLLFIGIGILLNDGDGAYWYLGLPYMAIFFTAAVVKEERFLRGKFGAAFDAYKASTPAFIPYGKWRGGDFSWARAFSQGGVKLIVSVVCMIAAMQAVVMLVK